MSRFRDKPRAVLRRAGREGECEKWERGFDGVLRDDAAHDKISRSGKNRKPSLKHQQAWRNNDPQQFKKQLREIRGLVEDLQKADGNEAETRRRVERILESVCGYDAFKHLSREHGVRGAGETEHIDFAIKVKPDEIAMVVELKRVGIDLNKKRLQQASRYATDLGCEWILLTNGRQWELHHLEFGQPPEIHLIVAWDLVRDIDKPEKIMEGFNLIAFQNIRKGGLGKLWARQKALTPRTLMAALLSESVLSALRTALRKEAGEGPPPNPEDVVAAIRKQLNDNARHLMDEVKISLPPRPAQPRRTRRAKPESEQPAKGGESTVIARPLPEETPAASGEAGETLP